MEIGKNLIQYDANVFFKFHANEQNILCDAMICNLWLFLDSKILDAITEPLINENVFQSILSPQCNYRTTSFSATLRLVRPPRIV